MPTAHGGHAPELPALVYVPTPQFTQGVKGLPSVSLVPAAHVMQARFDVGVGRTFSYCPATQLAGE